MEQKLLMAGCAALLSSVVSAVTPGRWSESFSDAKAYAEANGIPMVLVVGNIDSKGHKCEYCEALETALSDTGPVAWMEERQYVFCDVWAKAMKDDPAHPENKGAIDFAATAAGTKTKKLSAFPFVCLYWVQPDGSVVADNFSGRGPNDSSSHKDYMTANQFIEKVEAVLGGYGQSPAISAGETVGNRLEATLGRTTFVQVPVEGPTFASRQTYVLKAIFPDGYETETNVTLAAGAGRPDVWPGVEIPFDRGYRSGQAVRLELLKDGKAEAVDTNSITFVERENSPKNPTWRGVSAFGEWTMDLAAATNRVVAYKATHPGAKAYTLILLGGSMWCPDCSRTDAYLVDTPAFKQWAKDNNVACVAIDIPNWSKTAETGPCLLTRDVQKVSQKYIDADPEKGPEQSGVGYLSRWMVSDEDAAAQLAFNKSLVGVNTLNGGWNRPERTNQYRTGVPVFLLLNDDGTIAGRLEEFASTSPGEFKATNIDRLNDLLASAGRNESDVHWMTAGDHVLTVGDKGVSQLSAIDLSDYWRLGGVTGWVRGTFTVKSETSAMGSAADVELNLFRTNAVGVEKIASTNGCLRGGVTLEDIELTATDGYFIQVLALSDSATFSFERTGSSVVAYMLDSQAAPDPGTASFAGTGVTVKEADIKKAGGTMELNVPLKRQGGASGVLKAPVSVDAERTTAYDDQYELLDDHAEWPDGDRSAKGVRLLLKDDFNADGQRLVVLKCGETRYTVTLIDNDKTNAGKLALDSADPAMAKKGVVIATEGTKIRVGVSRIDGASGEVSASLTTTDGAILDSTPLSWVNRESGTLWREVELPMLAELGKKTALTVKLANLVGIKASVASVSVQLVAVDAPAFVEPSAGLSLVRTVAFERRFKMVNLHLAEGGKAKVAKLSGTLPSGLKVTVEGDEMVVAGVPTAKAGSYEAVYQVSETVGRVTTKGLTLRLGFTVDDLAKREPSDPGYNPFVKSAHTFADVMVVETATKRLAGLLTLTVPTTGKASAKYRCSAGTVSLSTKSWAEYEAATGALSAELLVSKKDYRLSLSATADGTLKGTVFDPAEPEATLEFACGGMPWSASHSAEAWQGRYTLTFTDPDVAAEAGTFVPRGDVTAALDMTSVSSARKGVMKYAGTLPNGQGFSGSSTLTAEGLDGVRLPMYYRNSKEYFTGAPRLTADVPRAIDEGEEEARILSQWRHDETGAAFEVRYGWSAGCVYDPKADLAALAMTSQGTDKRALVAAERFDPVTVTIQTAKPVLDSTEAKAATVKLSFSRSTGVVSGSFKTVDAQGKSVTASYKGVVLPAWDGCPGCGGDRPWAAGAFWHVEKVVVPNGTRTKTVSLKTGDIFMIEEK